MYYLLERDFETGRFETNLTMYGASPEDILNRVFPDGLYYKDSHEFDGGEAHCSMMYRHITTGKQIGIIHSVI